MKVQTVDELQVQVLVDNVTDNLSSLPSGVKHELAHLREGGLKELSGACLCCGAHGLSLLLKASYQGQEQQLLFDAGPEAEVFKRNVTKLQVDLGKVGALVLSHGHWDHAGGFLTALELIQQSKPGARPSFHLNPGMCVQRGSKVSEKGEVCPYKKIPEPRELEQKGARVHNSAEARLLLDDYFYLSGEIPRCTSYEKGFPEHLRQAEDQSWEPDPWILDERFLAVQVRTKGVVIFSACSHAGVVNVLKHAQEVFPGQPLYALMGGFHLSGASVEKIIPQTVEDLKSFNLQRIIPAHCTGWRAVSALEKAFGDQVVVPSAVGRTYLF